LFNVKHHILNILLKTKLNSYLLNRHVTSKKISVLEGLTSAIRIVLDDNFTKNIRITYRTNESPTTYADIIPTLMLARFYAAIGKKVEFVWDTNQLNPKVTKPERNEIQTADYLSDQLKLIRMIFLEFNNVSIKTESPSDTKDSFDFNFAINNLKQPLYRLAALILDESIKIWISGKRKLPESFYLDYGCVKNRTIAINFRFSTYDKRRNPSILSLKKDLKFIIKHFPNRVIIIFSDNRGLEKVSKSNILLDFNSKDTKIELQKSTSYSEAVFEVLKSEFFFMRKGGGICVPLFYSQSSYLILDNDFTHFYSRTPTRIFNFSRPDQQFRKIISRFQLRKVLKNSYSHIAIKS
jgi:hypothetical protein